MHSISAVAICARVVIAEMFVATMAMFSSSSSEGSRSK
jgi:hypothetical protein